MSDFTLIEDGQHMVRVTRRHPLTFDDMLDSWAEAEIDHLKGWLSTSTVQLIQQRLANPWDKEAARYAIFLRRRPLLLPFLLHKGAWYCATVDVETIGEIRTYIHEDDGYKTVGDLVERHPDMTIKDFDLKKANGRPILVSADGDTPWYVLEGAHRLCETVRLIRAAPCAGFHELEIVAGICHSLNEIIDATQKTFVDIPKEIR